MTSQTLAHTSAGISTALASHERRATLLHELAEQERIIVESNATLDELTASTDPTVAAARDVTAHRLAIALATRADVERALRRPDDGTYGLCDTCATPIAALRLEALPYTRHCIACA